MALLHLCESAPEVPGYTINVQFLPQADIMAALFISGEAKIGILPPNMAAKIASSHNKLQIAAVTGTGMLSLLSADPRIKRIEDLTGKTVELAGQGATPDFVFRKILQSKGMTAGSDIMLGYALSYPETAQALAAERIQCALLPEPYTTMAVKANNKLVIVSDIQKEWMQISQGYSTNTTVQPADSTVYTDNYPMTVLVVDRDFALAHTELINTILENVKESIEWVKANPGEAGLLAEKHELAIPAHVVQDSIPRSNYFFIPLPGARTALEALFSVFLEFYPASIGGVLPPDDFYYNSQLHE